MPYVSDNRARLRRAEMQRVFTHGRKFIRKDLILWCARRNPSTTPPDSAPELARMGLSVSKKVGSAVFRNRIKRLLREAFRLRRPSLMAVDVTVYPRPGCRWTGLKEADDVLMDLCRKAGILKS